MLNIHLKIEAKKTVIINGSNLLASVYFPEITTRAKAINILYRAFENDCFLLPYKVRKLSKRARRNLI
jgi:hypothetical protein